ncbi:MAG TPA: ABC transporter ATP-binding protein [Syntrophomonadaceae bacterium]|nr:ABC transporter ATP-binding protein [Syntrophomonadaceae bacterium]
MIHCQDLAKAFGQNHAVRGVNLKINRQEIFGLVGPDGAGKTTLIRMLCGLIKPDSGKVLLMEQPLAHLDKSQLGYMPQKFSLYPELTLMENIGFFGALYGLSKGLIQERADAILSLTGLSPFKDRLADQLSGGMKQKLSLTCSLITRPSILILDEPTYGVDPQSRKEFWRILYHLNQEGMTILLSTPYMDEAELCHRVAMIDEGTLLAVDNPEKLKKEFPYTVLEVRTSSKDPHCFDGLEGVFDTSFYGYKYHLFVEDLESGSLRIHDFLAARNLPLSGMVKVVPSMEDVFVELLKR